MACEADTVRLLIRYGWSRFRSDRVPAVPLGGADERFRSTLKGVADLDNEPPAITNYRAGATKLRRPTGVYVLHIAFSARDNIVGNVVSYRVAASAGVSSLSKAGQTATGPVTLTLRLHPPKNARRVRLEITASDPLDNTAKIVRWVKL